jgi:hypothetical protein
MHPWAKNYRLIISATADEKLRDGQSGMIDQYMFSFRQLLELYLAWLSGKGLPTPAEPPTVARDDLQGSIPDFNTSQAHKAISQSLARISPACSPWVDGPVARLVSIIAKAIGNPITIDWKAKDYAKRATTFGPDSAETSSQNTHRQNFPHRELGHIDTPCIFVATDGAIVGWYLPGALEGAPEVRLYLCIISFPL